MDEPGAQRDLGDQPTDSRLDFTSPLFDPTLALETAGLQPPVLDAPLLDNVSKCAALLPSATAQREPQQTEAEAAEAAKAAQAKKAKAAALKQRALRTAQRAEASVTLGSLTSIMAKAAVGPLAVLAKWQAAGQRVLVVTRHAAGVRGKAVGVLKGFDKFMNLILADVEELYTVIVKVQRVKQQQLPQQHQQAMQPRSLTEAHTAGSTSLQQQQHQQDSSGLPQQQQHQQDSSGLPQEQQRAQTQVQPDVTQQHTQQQHQLQQLQWQSKQQQQHERSTAATRTRVRWCRKQEQRYRKLDQVLLIGDSVVLVSGQPPASLCPTT